MTLRCSRWLVVAALIFSLGCHWFVLQTVGWVGMAVKFSQTLPLSEALSRTFDGQNPCKICHIVDAGKKAEQEKPVEKIVPKLDFLIVAQQYTFVAPHQFIEQTAPDTFYSARDEAPPGPPPRLV